MKIVAAGFFTALMIFVVATAMSELLSTADKAQVTEPTPRPKPSGVRSTADGGRSHRGASKQKKSELKPDTDGDARTIEIQERLSQIRLRESEIKARQEALQIVYAEIREEQQSVEQLRRKVSEEIALLKDAALRISMQERRPTVAPTVIAMTPSSAKPIESSTNTRPMLTIKDLQTVRDTAVLVNHLARRGSLGAATSLLRKLKERDAARVLAELDATDSEMALRLTQNLQATRNNTATRR